MAVAWGGWFVYERKLGPSPCSPLILRVGFVATIAREAVDTAGDLFARVTADRERVVHQAGTTLLAVRLFDHLPSRPLDGHACVGGVRRPRRGGARGIGWVHSDLVAVDSTRHDESALDANALTSQGTGCCGGPVPKGAVARIASIEVRACRRDG